MVEFGVVVAILGGARKLPLELDRTLACVNVDPAYLTDACRCRFRIFATWRITVETLSTHHASHQQPAPFVLGHLGEERPEESFDFWGILNRRKWLVFLGLVVGMGLGGLYHAKTDVIYESKATIKIEPKNPLVMQFTNSDAMLPNAGLMFANRHDRRIATDNNLILKCLETNNLYNLESFDEMAREEVVPFVRENLEVIPDKEEPFIYELTYKATDAYDAKTILNNIIATYQNELETMYRDESEEFITLLKEVKNQFQNSYLELESEVQQLVDENDSPAIYGKGQNIHQMNLAVLNNRIKDNQDQLNMLAADRERILKALEGGEKEMEEMFWILRQSKRITLSDAEDRRGFKALKLLFVKLT